MTTITILPETADSYRALARDKESTGRTAGEALDALTAQLSDDESGMLVIVQHYKADEFFNAAEQERLTELMQLRQARPLSSEEEQELENLVEVELNGARLRAEGRVGGQHGEIPLHSLTDHEKDIKDLMYILAESGSPEERHAVLKELFERLKKRREGVVSQEPKRKTG